MAFTGTDPVISCTMMAITAAINQTSDDLRMTNTHSKKILTLKKFLDLKLALKN